MKKLIFLFLIIHFYSQAQTKQIKIVDCGTKPKTGIKKISKEKMTSFLEKQNALPEPYSISIYFTVFADNDGSNRATSDVAIKRQFENMVNQFTPHGICFTYVGIRQINNSDFNIQDVDDEEDEMNGIKDNRFFNIFIHNSLVDGSDPLNGSAYDVPNTNNYISLWGGVVTSTTNVSTMSHEMGHALGLYHTFEEHPWDPFHGKENVARSGSCADCDEDGDLICDTPADPNDSNHYLELNTNNFCNYTGTKTDDCGWQYSPLTSNLMTYGDRKCRRLFTSGQANRIKYFLTNEPSFNSVLAPSTVLLDVPQIISSNNIWGIARDLLTVQPSSGNIIINGTTNLLVQSKKIQLKNGTKLSPSAGGRIVLKNNIYCN